MNFSEKEEACIKAPTKKGERNGWKDVENEFKRFNVMECSNHLLYGLTKDEYQRCGMEALIRVADKYAHQIKVLSPEHQLFYVVGKSRSGMGPGLFDRPEGVVIHDDKVWFSDTYNNRIVRYRINE